MSMPEGGPKATSLDFTGSRGITLIGSTGFAPAPVTAHDEAFGCDLQWWAGRVAFTQRFRLTEPKEAKVNIKISFMTCNGSNCTPPQTANISAPIPAYKP